MKYFFILGNHPTISAAEIASKLPSAKFNFVQKEVMIVDLENIKLVKNLIKTLGGTIKIGIILKSLNHTTQTKIINSILEQVKPQTSKYKFGISVYNAPGINTKAIGMEIKNNLKDRGVSSRLVVSREKQLSSVVITQNKLIDMGAEFVIIRNKGKLEIGQTIAVQAFKDLSFRDYGRPARDDESGMLPPKLAQIMINLSQTSYDDIILDPFCGSGTILSEAAIMGYQNILGSDYSKKAITDTQKNIAWIKKKFGTHDAQFKIFQCDVKKISQSIDASSLGSIVTEPYLGPQRGKANYQEVAKELNILYSKAISEFSKIIKPGGKIVMIWPRFLVKNNFINLNPDINKFKIINPLPASLVNNKYIKLTKRNTMIYGRQGQKVWREIVILNK